MSTPSLYEMLTFSFSGELPLEQISERDQLILSVMDNMQRIINCRAGTLAHLPDYGLPDLSLIHQGMAAGIHGLMRQIEETLLRYEPRLSQIQVELLPQPRPGHLNYLIHAQLPDTGWIRFDGGPARRGLAPSGKTQPRAVPAKWRGTTDAGLLRTGDNQTAGAGRDGRRTRFTGYTAPALG